MKNIRYLLTAFAAALIAAGEVFKDYADNTPGDDVDDDGVITGTQVADGVATLDKSGLPHHPSIHASTKTIKADGTWTRRKGVDDVTYAAVVAELRKTHPAPTAAAAPTPAPAPVTAGPAIKLPTKLVPPKAKTAYEQLCDWLAANVGKGDVTQEWVNTSFAEGGVTLAELATDEKVSAEWLEAFQGAVAG